MFKTLEEIYSYKQNITIFDIGAYDFADSLNMKRQCPEADVYAFEPDFNNLFNHAEKARKAGVIVYDHAIGDKNGKVKFFPSESLNGIRWSASGSIVEPVTKENSSEGISHSSLFYNLDGYEVWCRTIESFCEEMGIETVEYMHIDAQGGEFKILSNLGNIRPLLIKAETSEWTNYKTGVNLEEFDNLMANKGYNVLERYEFDTLYSHFTNN